MKSVVALLILFLLTLNIEAQKFNVISKTENETTIEIKPAKVMAISGVTLSIEENRLVFYNSQKKTSEIYDRIPTPEDETSEEYFYQTYKEKLTGKKFKVSFRSASKSMGEDYDAEIFFEFTKVLSKPPFVYGKSINYLLDSINE